MNTLNEFLKYLRHVNFATILVRLTLASICGGILGLENGKKKRPAGFRTHIVVCIGASIIMITTQYMSEVLGLSIDASRMGAQVISGIGFLGAGTIIVIGHNQVKGLTTAAGLWACGCMGLAIGIGFYEGALISCIYLFVVITLLHKLDLYSRTHSKTFDVYIEIEHIIGITNFLNVLKADGTKLSNIEIKKCTDKDKHRICLNLTLTLSKKIDHGEYLLQLHNIEGVLAAEEVI